MEIISRIAAKMSMSDTLDRDRSPGSIAQDDDEYAARPIAQSLWISACTNSARTLIEHTNMASLRSLPMTRKSYQFYIYFRGPPPQDMRLLLAITSIVSSAAAVDGMKSWNEACTARTRHLLIPKYAKLK